MEPFFCKRMPLPRARMNASHVVVRISQDPTSKARVSHDQGHIYIPLWIHLSYIHTDTHRIHNQSTDTTIILLLLCTHTSSPLHVLLSSNLDSVRVKEKPVIN